MRIRKRVTATQLEANRRNSLKSTGPKTQSGKLHSSRNSWKHGILSAQVPVIDGRGRENAQQFGALLAKLQKDLEPCGTLEDLLVQQIAIAYWRLARVHRCEAAEIAKNSESVEDRFDEHQRQSVAEGDPDLMRNSSRGIEMFSQTLRRADMELKLVGYLTDLTISRLAASSGSEVGEFLEVFKQMTKDAAKAPTPDGLTDKALGAKLTRRALAVCGPYVDELMEYVNARERVRWNNDLLSASLPDPAAVDRLLRYEASIQRGLDRSLARLERLQRMRKGEAVPLTVRVQTRGDFAKRSHDVLWFQCLLRTFEQNN